MSLKVGNFFVRMSHSLDPDETLFEFFERNSMQLYSCVSKLVYPCYVAKQCTLGKSSAKRGKKILSNTILVFTQFLYLYSTFGYNFNLWKLKQFLGLSSSASLV